MRPLWAALARNFVSGEPRKWGLATGVSIIIIFHGSKKKYCLYPHGNESVEGEEEFTEQKKEEIMA